MHNKAPDLMNEMSKSCVICSVPIGGTRRIYCGDRCKWRANNRRRDPAKEAQPERIKQRQDARRRYNEKNGRAPLKYPGDPEWRKKPRTRKARSVTITPEQRAAQKRLAEKRRKYLRRSRNSTVQTVRFSAVELAARFAYWGNRCWVCDCVGDLHIDHVKPLSKGGPNMLSNHRPICPSCNSRKGAKWPYLETVNAPAHMRQGVD